MPCLCFFFFWPSDSTKAVWSVGAKVVAAAGFRSLRSVKKPLLNGINKRKRLEFAKKYTRTDWATVNGATFSCRKQLWTVPQEAFAAITPEQVNKLVKSMPSRLAAVKVARGGPTRY